MAEKVVSLNRIVRLTSMKKMSNISYDDGLCFGYAVYNASFKNMF